MSKQVIPRVSIRPGTWKHGGKAERDVLRVIRHKGKQKFIAGIVEWDEARALADAIHDACDAHEAKQRERTAGHE